MKGTDQQRLEAFGQKHRTSLVTLLFTDMVGSTELKQRLGDHPAAQLIDQHHRLTRETLQGFSEGEELSVSGDSFFLVFATPSAAVSFALVLQQRLRELSRQAPAPVQDRLGLHLGEVLVQPKGELVEKDLAGLNVDICSRVMGLSQGGQILLTRPVFDSARQALKGEDLPGLGELFWLNHGPYELKGIDEPVEICEVRQVEAGPLTAPKTSEKARRMETAEAEAVLGWRPAVGQVVPGTQWVLQEKLGEGGFGEVWLGRHQAMKERRVFKFCFRADRVRALKREMTLFRLIKESIGDHPNIVKLIEVYFESPPFYVEEEYVAGQDLAKWCAAKGGAREVPLDARLEIVAQIADALQAAHDAGVIHRDVKPGNILISSRKSDPRKAESKLAERACEAPPTSTWNLEFSAKLTDFGIGQVVSAEVLAGVTRAGFTETMLSPGSSSQTGTHLYMAPELLTGRPASIRSDIYSLGVVFYQLLVGDLKEPVTADWPGDISDPLLREDLQRCFARDPANRFAGASELARNLRSLPQRRVELTEREQVRQQAARRRLATRVSAAVVSGLILLAGAMGYGLHRARVEALNSRRIAYVSDMNLAWRALQDNNLGEVRALLAAHLPAPDGYDLRAWEWRYLWRASRGEQRWTLGPFAAYVTGLAWLPEGRLLAGSRDPAGLTVWETETRELVRACNLPNEVSGLAVSPSGRLIAVADWQKVVRLLSAESLQAFAELSHDTAIIRVAFSPDSKLLSCRGGEELTLWDVEGRIRLWTTNGISNSHSDAPFSPDGRVVFCQMQGDYLGMFNPTNGALLKSAGSNYAFASQIAFSKEGDRLAAGDWGGRIYVLDLARSASHIFTNRTGPSYAVAFAPDGRTLAVGGVDAVIRLWDLESGTERTALRGHGKEVTGLLYSPDGQTLYSSARDGTVRAWNVTQVRPPQPPLIPPDAMSGRMTRNGRMVPLYRPGPQLASVFDLQTHRESPRSPFAVTNFARVQSLALCPCGREAVFGLRDGSLQAWKEGRFEPKFLRAHSNAVVAVEFSSDCSLLASAAKDGDLRVWEWPGFQPILRRTVGDARDMVFARDGRLLVVAAGDIFIIPLRGGKDRQIPGGGYVPAIALSGDASLLAAGFNSEVRVWELKSLRLVRRLEGSHGDFGCVSFSPDGRRVLASNTSGMTWLWDLATGRDVARFQPKGRLTVAARFQDNGDAVVLQSGSLDANLAAEVLSSAPWTEIEKVERAEAKVRQIWTKRAPESPRNQNQTD